eukprot:gene4069-4450_t
MSLTPLARSRASSLSKMSVAAKAIFSNHNGNIHSMGELMDFDATAPLSVPSSPGRANEFVLESSKYSQYFQQWEEEERALQEVLAQERLAKAKEEDEEFSQELPPYLQELFKELDQEEEPATPLSKLPTVVIMGRPNTGKSTIVNRITESYKDGSIVHDQPGITRDRTYRPGFWCDYNFQVVDTGGIVFEDNDDIFADRITQQALTALKEADVAVMVCNGQEGVTQLDTILADWIRKNIKIPLYVAVNKCESTTQGFSQAQEFWSLGLGEPLPVSGIHGSGINDLLDKVISHIPKVTNILQENATNVALVGRPNVGKSSLLNRLYGEERSIVSEVAGTTRDAIDALVTRGNKTYRIIDTAGIRKRGKVQYGPEFFMVNRAFKAIRRSEVVILVLDAIQGIVDQDRILAERITEEGRACVIALNKWDVLPNKDDKSYLKAVENIRTTLPTLRWADIVLVSALTGLRTEKLFQCIDRSAVQFNRRISTAVLNEVVNDATLWMAPPSIGARSGRIYYCIQINSSPPTIVFFVNDPDLFTENYQRYLERKIRDSLKFEGTPIRMIWRGKSLRDVDRAARKGELGRAVTQALTGKSHSDSHNGDHKTDGS